LIPEEINTPEKLAKLEQLIPGRYSSVKLDAMVKNRAARNMAYYATLTVLNQAMKKKNSETGVYGRGPSIYSKAFKRASAEASRIATPSDAEDLIEKEVITKHRKEVLSVEKLSDGMDNSAAQVLNGTMLELLRRITSIYIFKSCYNKFEDLTFIA